MSEQCPKCGAPKADESCPKCGLMYDRYDPEREHVNVPSMVRDLWENVEKNWADNAAHALFMEQGIAQGAAGFVAACYRGRGDDPIARAQLEKLTGRLIQSLDFVPKRAPVASRPFRQMAYLLLFMIIAVLVFLIFAHAMK